MRPSNELAKSAREREALLRELRANAAFEHMAVAVLSGAALCGALYAGLHLGLAIIANRVALDTVFTVVFGGLIVSFSTFFIGFLAGVVVVAPLFKSMEKNRRRSVWPYLAASLGVAIIALTGAANLPGQRFSMLTAIPVFSASALIAFIFARRMQPVWAAAEGEEEREEETDRGPTLKLPRQP